MNSLTGQVLFGYEADDAAVNEESHGVVHAALKLNRQPDRNDQTC